eukprot:Em0003g1069a
MALARIIFAGSCLLLCTVCLSAQNGDSVTSLATSACSNSSDCYPAGLNGTSVPIKYINCSNQKCVCSGCFYATISYKSCAYQSCWEYAKTTQTCNDLRKDQRTAFLLSLFLSALGAANFYIERYDLGGIQLCCFLLLPVILFGFYCVIIIVLLLFNESRYGGCEDDGIIAWPFLILSCVWLLLNLMWWVADIVTFSENLRMSGDGCPLKQNL